jgi:hypothetical protein
MGTVPYLISASISKEAVMFQTDYPVGVFENRSQAERAVHDLRGAGFPADEIVVLMHREDAVEITDLDAAKAAQVTGHSRMAEGAAVGAATGAMVGGLLALVPAAIPGVGPVLSVGTLAAGLFGVAAGSTGGYVVGVLVGADFPDEYARFFEHELKAGHILVGVKTQNRSREARDILHYTGGNFPLMKPVAVAESV